MAWHPVREAVQCPTCAVWVDGTLAQCSWCTVDLRTGSWQNADLPVALRELRHHWSALEFGPTDPHQLLPDDVVSACGTDAGYRRHRRDGEDACEPCLAAHQVKTREWKRKSRARLAARQEAA